MTTGLPIIAVPTTYAGSEATNVWGLTEASRKTTGVDARVLPSTVVYDADADPVPAGGHERGLRAERAGPLRGLDVGAARGPDRTRRSAPRAIRALRDGLPAVVADPTGLDGREQTLYGAYLSAVAFASAGSGLHHKICHVLGGTFDLPHAQTHAMVLPYVLAFNAPAAPAADGASPRRSTPPSALDGLQDLRERLDAPRALRTTACRRTGSPAAADGRPCRQYRPATRAPSPPTTISATCCAPPGTGTELAMTSTTRRQAELSTHGHR